MASDPRRRGQLASGGYFATAIATSAIGLTVAVWQAAVLRAIAWVARVIRSPARDMLLTSLTSLTSRGAWGRAFGHRYIPKILDRMSRDEVKTEHLGTRVLPLDDGPKGYRMFRNKEGRVRSCGGPPERVRC